VLNIALVPGRFRLRFWCGGRVLGEFESVGATLAVVTPETRDFPRRLKWSLGLDLRVLSDVDYGVAVSYGMLFRVIDAFYALDQECSRELYEQLNADRPTRHDNGGEIASRYGLRKVFKEEFDGEPERFVLRIGFPDFPPCPFGHSFSMLGFDTAEQSYVWLVTSILRDSRLERVPVPGGPTCLTSTLAHGFP
jgi:hypothetical protein